MEYIRVSAKTVAEAVIEASIQLETSSENIEYEVLEKESAGFLGFGKKPAVIRARRKEIKEEKFEEDILESIKETVKSAAEPEHSFKPIEKPAKKPPAQTREEKPEAAFQKKEEKREFAGRTEKRGYAPQAREEKRESFQTRERRQEPAVQARREALSAGEKEEAAGRAEDFLGKTLKAMGMDVNIKCSFDAEDTLDVELSGGDMGILIGKRGQTLDAVQYLTSLAVNKGKASYVRVKVDTEDYRRRRRETLENLARNIASKVRRTRKTVFLEPMNPYERRIIHSALQNNPYVSTHSEGEEPYRKVVVTPKRQNDPERRERRSFANNPRETLED